MKPPAKHWPMALCLIAALALLILPIGNGARGAREASAATIKTLAKQAILLDAETGTVLLQKNADQRVPPSSMSKMMTVYMLFERLKEGSLNMDDTFLISKKAWKKGGSKMWVEVGKRIRIRDLLRGIIVQSGNDASIAVAEGLAGDETSFAELVNAKAAEIGLNNSTFKNASGWPEEGHMMTVRDIAKLSLLTINNFPELYKIYSEKSFRYHNIRQPNRNPILFGTDGGDGLKTGHTEAAGYGLAGSAIRKGQRLILVVNGLPSQRSRTVESRRLIEWGFREFRNFTLFAKGEAVEQAAVWLGKDKTVPLVLDEKLTITLPRRARYNAKVKVVYTGPIAAPIKKGTVIAKLVISAPNVPVTEFPLKAGRTVERLGFAGRISASLRHLLWGNLK